MSKSFRQMIGGLMAVAMLCGSAAMAQDRPPPVREPEPRELSEHQDSSHLTRITSAVLPPDGLFTVGLEVHQYETVLILNDFLNRIDHQDYSLSLEAGLRSWLHAKAEVPWRGWSGGVDWVPPTGSGLGDGSWRLVAGNALSSKRFHVALIGGGNIPLGDSALGLGEGHFSPYLGAAMTWVAWRESALPEMRLHLNLGRTWNQAEDAGYGAGEVFLNPWPPRYQSADTAGGTSRNDTNDLGVGLEFRSGTTSLWVEYSQQVFHNNDTVSTGEQMRMVGAGLRWGLVEEWALHANYLVSLADDDEDTAWWPGYPDMVTSIGLSRQFGFGGADRDGDGVRDRDDYCPDNAEDLDGFQDADGCPDYDNDMDGVPDTLDEAPLDPEDYDGFEDGDGAPDFDNDEDGVPDSADLCPDEAEDLDGHNDDDGCPDEFADRDGDGVEDALDGCPDEPEDMDDFEDEDGCPEADNDLDGLPDESDACPDEAEDYNGVDDDDGCPDDE